MRCFNVVWASSLMAYFQHPIFYYEGGSDRERGHMLTPHTVPGTKKETLYWKVLLTLFLIEVK